MDSGKDETMRAKTLETTPGSGNQPKLPLNQQFEVTVFRIASAIDQFTIRKKIWISFAFLVALLVTVGVIAFSSLKTNKEKLSTLVDEVQPAMELSLRLVDQLDRASASLGFYLLSKETVHKDDFLNNMNNITQSVATLSSMRVVEKDPETLKMVAQVRHDIEKLQTYKEQMLVFAADESKNVPALGYAGREVNPRAQIMLQSLQEMLFAESGETANATRRQFLLDLFF